MSDNQRPAEPRDPELVLPFTVFRDVVRYPDLILILPYESSEGWFADYQKIVKVAALEDRWFGPYTEGERGQPFIGHVFYDIHQIRECKVRDVPQSDWLKNLGPTRPQQWMQHYKRGPHSPVRIYHMNRVTYNLQTFNREYGWGLK